MSEHLGVYPGEDVELRQRRSTLVVPALLATCIGLPLIALSALVHVVGEVLIHLHPAWLTPAGTTYLPPSDSERVKIVARAATPDIAGLAFLALTWRFRNQGRRGATVVCAVVVVLMGVAALW